MKYLKLFLRLISIFFATCTITLLLAFFICRNVWENLDFETMILHAHLLFSYSLTMFMQEIILGCFVFVLIFCFSCKFLKTSLLISLIITFAYGCNNAHYIFSENNLFKNEYTIPNISATKNTKNIIVISLESFEEALALDDVTGSGNLFPKLTELKKEGVSFSGYKEIQRIASYTLPSFYAKNCGIGSRADSLDIVKSKEYREYARYPQKKCISDILINMGYSVYFIMGGKLTDEGAKNFFELHPISNAWGRLELEKLGYHKPKNFSHIPDGDLYDMAKKILNQNNGTPFALHIITANTHFPEKGGYWVEKQCQSEYNDVRDAYKCLDKITYDFIRWCKAQPWYENTVIYLIGDHLAHANFRVFNWKQHFTYREIYNLALNSGYHGSIHKEYTLVDFTPTFLDSMGFPVLKYGLGYSLFRENPTLVEKLGIGWFEELLSQQR